MHITTSKYRYEQELGDLNMFISHKTDLEGELEDTKMELLKERKKHEQIITELERKTLQVCVPVFLYLCWIFSHII